MIPVHTYLKEIGQVPLLRSDQEVWLSTQLAAAKVLDRLNEDAAEETNDDDTETVRSQAMLSNYANLLENWEALKMAAGVIEVDLPDPLEIINEARQLRQTWRDAEKSFVRTYLNAGRWGQDEAWTRFS